MSRYYEMDRLETSLSQLELAAVNFAQRSLKDSEARLGYLNQTRKMSQDYREKVAGGSLTAENATKQVEYIRHDIIQVTGCCSTEMSVLFA